MHRWLLVSSCISDPWWVHASMAIGEFMHQLTLVKSNINNVDEIMHRWLLVSSCISDPWWVHASMAIGEFMHQWTLVKSNVNNVGEIMHRWLLVSSCISDPWWVHASMTIGEFLCQWPLVNSCLNDPSWVHTSVTLGEIMNRKGKRFTPCKLLCLREYYRRKQQHQTHLTEHKKPRILVVLTVCLLIRMHDVDNVTLTSIGRKRTGRLPHVGN